MAIRRLLYFTAEDHYVYAASRGSLELEASFSDNEAGLDEFRQYLQSRRDGLFSVVADLAGEDFHEDQIPSLRGAERDAVVQRRLAQRYRDTRLAAALSLGRVVTPERRNERLLLASFTNTQQLAPWLDALDESGARLAGVFSVPLLAPALAARLGARTGRCIIVTANRTGLRQCFVEEGRLRFARLERTVEMVPQALALFVRSETQRLAQYLVTLRALPREGAPVRVLVVAPRGQKAAFEQALIADGRLAFQALDADEAAGKAGLRRVPEGTGAEALYLQMAAKKPPREQFASRQDRRRYEVWQLQRGIVAAGALAFAACGVYAGGQALQGVRIHGEAAVNAHEARLAAEAYQRITAAFPVTQTTTENLKVTVTEFRRLAQKSATPENDFARVSRVLERFPQFEIDVLTWSIAERRDKPAAAGAPGPGSASGSAVQVEMSGRVNATQRGDYRGITAQVQQFAAALGDAGYELGRTQLPFDITSEGTLTGDIAAAGDGNEAPRFTVTLVRRVP
ncbi:MAG TPA: hypothetical protein VIQ55_06365 [Burkholderiales bacterium]|jgi:hypothetical protein